MVLIFVTNLFLDVLLFVTMYCYFKANRHWQRQWQRKANRHWQRQRQRRRRHRRHSFEYIVLLYVAFMCHYLFLLCILVFQVYFFLVVLKSIVFLVFEIFLKIKYIHLAYR